MNTLIKQKKLLKRNTIASLGFQFTAIVCGFITPRLVLAAYGSDVNGLISSIKQFLSIISLLELGVGAVVQASLYGPLANNDKKKTNEILTSANSFFTKIGINLSIYVIVLLFVYPLIVDSNFNWIYTVLLIGAISISFFSQYYFGVVDRLFLNSAQHGYVQYNAQTITLILNTFIGFVLIKLHCSIQLFQLVSSLIYLARPLYLRLYINKNFDVKRNASYEGEPISQKWSGIAQHISAVVLDQTDIIVLTIFASLSDVSIYYVYFLVVNGVKQLFLSIVNGFQSLLGELWAKRELNVMYNFFSHVEWIIHTGVVFIFGSTAFLIAPFISVYTRGITDANYIQPVFAVLITFANAGHCLRLPYNIMILAGAHFKQTQSNYIIAALLNILISVLAVFRYGLVGVAIGTLVAMYYQTIWMAIYNSKNLLRWPIINFIKQIGIDLLTIVIAYIMIHNLNMAVSNYVQWFLLAIKIAIIMVIDIFFVNLIFYRSKILSIINRVTTRVKTCNF